MASNKKEWRWPVLIFSNFFPLDQINPYWWCWWQICSIERRYIDLIEKRKKYWPTQTSITSQYLFQFLPLDSHTQAGSASPPHNNSLGSVVSMGGCEPPAVKQGQGVSLHFLYFCPFSPRTQGTHTAHFTLLSCLASLSSAQHTS